jgi:mRNA-degrading endonuclease RelE of RelBE toxin-antitoxin system
MFATAKSSSSNLPSFRNLFGKVYGSAFFEQLPSANSLEQIGRFEKLQGYPNHFKARFGNYRLGIAVLENMTIEVITVLHRKDIYRFFP